MRCFGVATLAWIGAALAELRPLVLVRLSREWRVLPALLASGLGTWVVPVLAVLVGLGALLATRCGCRLPSIGIPTSPHPARSQGPGVKMRGVDARARCPHA